MTARARRKISNGRPVRVVALAAFTALAATILVGCGTAFYEIPIETPIKPKLDVSPFQRVLVVVVDDDHRQVGIVAGDRVVDLSDAHRHLGRRMPQFPDQRSRAREGVLVLVGKQHLQVLVIGRCPSPHGRLQPTEQLDCATVAADTPAAPHLIRPTVPADPAVPRDRSRGVVRPRRGASAAEGGPDALPGAAGGGARSAGGRAGGRRRPRVIAVVHAGCDDAGVAGGGRCATG